MQTALELGNIRAGENDHDKIVDALHVIADTDSELFAQMQAKEWNIAACSEYPELCTDMMFRGSIGWSPPIAAREEMKTDVHTFVSIESITDEAKQIEVDFSAYLASILAHEFVHLFEGPSEHNPVECSLRFAKKYGDEKLIAYVEKKFLQIGSDNEWETNSGILDFLFNFNQIANNRPDDDYDYYGDDYDPDSDGDDW